MIKLQQKLFNYIITKHTPLSWDVKVRIEKWLKSHGYSNFEVDFTHENVDGYILTFVDSAPIDHHLELLDAQIPSFISGEATKAEKEKAKCLEEIQKWLASHTKPLAPTKKTLVNYHKNIIGLWEDLEADFKKGEVLPCGLGDLNDNVTLYKHILNGDITKAKKAIWDMDTGARDYIPGALYDVLMNTET